MEIGTCKIQKFFSFRKENLEWLLILSVSKFLSHSKKAAIPGHGRKCFAGKSKNLEALEM